MTRLAAAALLLLAGCGSRTDLRRFPTDAGPPADPEVCNGADDDLDGRVDEEIPEQTCGTGACERTAPGCAEGRVPVCDPGPPFMESCGGGDEDCDGRVDEGLGFGPLGDPILVSSPRVDLGPFNSDLVATESGLLSFYRVSFDGSDPMPNLSTVPLDPDGRPTREPTNVIERPVTNGPRATPSAAGRIAFAYCGRVTGTGDDYTTAAMTDAAGTPASSDTVATGSDQSCGATDPDILWTGERHIVAWTDNRGGSAGADFATQLDIMDEALRSVRAIEYFDEAFDGDLSASPRLGINGDAVLLAWGVRPIEDRPRSELRMRVLDRQGAEVGPEVVLGPPPPLPGADRADWGPMVIVPRADGFLLYSGGRSRDGGLLAMDVAPDGRPRGEARYVAEMDGQIGHLRGAPRPGGGAYLTLTGRDTSRLLRMDATGALIDAHAIDLEDLGFEHFTAWPAVTVRGGRVFVSWTRLTEGTGSEVYVRAYGCVP